MSLAVTAAPIRTAGAGTVDACHADRRTPDPRGLRIVELDAARQAEILDVLSVLVHTLGPRVGMTEVHRHWDATYLGRVAGTGGPRLGWWFRLQSPVLTCEFDSDVADPFGPDLLIPDAR